MEYTTMWQPLVLIFVSVSIGGAIGSFYMFWSLHTENKLLQIDLEMVQEKLQRCAELYSEKEDNEK